jgi:aminoglycoside 6'-N-acetyltransferase I
MMAGQILWQPTGYHCGMTPCAFPREDNRLVEQAARLLVDGFRVHWPAAWPTLEDALAEVREALESDRICRAALDDAGDLVGWIAGIPEYAGRVWELHPLVVRADRRRQGIGRALVEDLVEQVGARGGIMLMLGTDDEDHMTSLGGVDVFPEPLAHLMRLEDRAGHPSAFYRRLGFAVVGIVPDANGFGKPDILMARRVAPRPAVAARQRPAAGPV